MTRPVRAAQMLRSLIGWCKDGALGRGAWDEVLSALDVLCW